MKVREYCYVKRSRSISVLLGYVYVNGRFLLQAQFIKYILVAFGLAPAAGIVINNA